MRTQLALGLASLALPLVSQAAPPMIYEGSLTTANAAPDPWPAMRFVLEDAGGNSLWTGDTDGAVALDPGPDGRFVAYMEDDALLAVPYDEGTWLAVEVCVEVLEDGCRWLRLDPRSPLGMVPLAAQAAWVPEQVVRDHIFQREDLFVGGDGDFESVHAALEYLAEKRIPANATVTIHVAAGIYQHDTPIRLSHPDGDRIHIVGDPERPDLVRLDFDRSHGVLVGRGNALGGLNGMTLIGDRGQAGGGSFAGISVGGHATIGPALVVRDFTGYGITTSAGSIYADEVRVENAGFAGFYANRSGHIGATRAVATDCSNLPGFRADGNATIIAVGSRAERNATGYNARQGGVINASGAVGIDNGVLDDPDQGGAIYR